MQKMFTAALMLFVPFVLQASEDSEFRAEILGEQGGKAIASDHGEYQPEKAKKACGDLFADKWVKHFKEKGFDTDEATAKSFVAGCMKAYTKKLGK